MTIRPAATAAWIVALCACAHAGAAEPLPLDEAFRRAAAHHPELRQLELERELLTAELARSGQRPAFETTLQLENALGTGQFEGAQQAELTLSLGSAIERGGKRALREVLAGQPLQALQPRQRARALDLLAEVARRHVAAAAAVALQRVAEAAVAQHEAAVARARDRHSAGASPQSIVLAAEVALARAGLTLSQVRQQDVSARQHLAALWSQDAPDFTVSDAGFLTPAALEPLPSLVAQLQQAPELQQFGIEQAVRESRLRLARADAIPDVDWRLGVRRLQAGNDFAMVGELTIPLGSRARSAPQVEAATSELAALDLQREAATMRMASVLTEMHGRHHIALLEVQQLQDEVLPKLVRAEEAAGAAFNAGAAGFGDWMQLQAELAGTRVRQIEAAREAHLASIEVRRLTGSLLPAGVAAISGDLP